MSDSFHCNWSVWYRTHFTYEKTEFDTAGNQMRHAALRQQVEKELADEGFAVYHEIWFRVEGEKLDFGGRCDIVAVREDDGKGIICELKGGNKYASDELQLLLYLWALPRASQDTRFKGIEFEGLLAYENERRFVSRLNIDEVFMKLFKSYVHDIIHNEPAQKHPSYFGCKFCNIANCDERQTDEDVPLINKSFRPDFF